MSTIQTEKLAEEVVEEESLLTELTIMPDGRVYVFGASRRMLDVLESLQPDDSRIATLLAHVRETEKQG
jgi:hypothetical protein